MIPTSPAQGWHTDPELIRSYVAGDLDAVTGASVEQHLGRCAACRTTVAPLVDRGTLESAWASIRAGVERAPQPLAVRLARRAGLREPASVLLAATASLRTAWVASALVALGFAATAVMVSGGHALASFLLVAPLVPVIGVAAAYGPRQDPLETLVVSTPYGRTRLVLLRTLAVLVSVLPFAAALGLLLPGPPWVAGAWLGPALALVPVLMALASFVGPRPAAAAVAIAWSGVVLMSVRMLPPTWPVQAPQQLAYLGLAVLAGVVLLVRARRDHRIGAVL